MAVSIPLKTMLRILKKEGLLSRHGVTPVLHVVMWNWRRVCFALKSKCYVDRLMIEIEENDRLDEAQKKRNYFYRSNNFWTKRRLHKSFRKRNLVNPCLKWYMSCWKISFNMFQGMLANTILKVTPGAQKWHVVKILGCAQVPTISPPKKKHSPTAKLEIEEPLGYPTQNTRSQSTLGVMFLETDLQSLI